ncbi:sigma-70 family RNA polymerase sigma factor [Kitasatospora sp. NBC_01287]|uniref:RNA polymerase sigma factor n=1 Tax=Kitasatospora sp. NBC_01287 TaxID=2903573 RepID=UPI0022530BC6|nr:sigma-70 family RNA polymerase sigma factor [Kitasatospora sp. NBC_01287]MCX4744384.1 sigma-70 family RNA polymerase sigma factor [Kitasatospora sp. NBC_01287]
MTIDKGGRTPGRPGGPAVDSTGEGAASARLRLSYQVFCELHGRAWLAFARTRIGNLADAELVVAAMKEELAQQWPHALRHPTPAAYAWRLLKSHLHQWAWHQDEVEVEATTFAAVIGRFKELAGDSLRSEEDQVGLYGSILALPDRQRDVVILRYVLDLDDLEIAAYLDHPVETVRSNLRHARERLARRLGIGALPDRRAER